MFLDFVLLSGFPNFCLKDFEKGFFPLNFCIFYEKNFFILKKKEKKIPKKRRK